MKKLASYSTRLRAFLGALSRSTMTVFCGVAASSSPLTTPRIGTGLLPSYGWQQSSGQPETATPISLPTPKVTPAAAKPTSS